MKRVLILLVAGSVLSGVAAYSACTARAKPASTRAPNPAHASDAAPPAR